MRPNNNQRRGRGRAGRRPNVPARAQTYDSNGPGGRIRGNATQVYEKYVALARDAMAAGDRVLAEGLNQHAEHYFRIINDSTDPEPLRPPAPPKEEIEVSQPQSQDAAEQPAASNEAPAEATQSEADSQQQPPRRSRRRPRPPMGDGEAAGEASQAKPTQPADEQAGRSEASEQPSAEDEGLRKMLSATGGAATGGASGGNASSRRRKSNGSAETKEPDASDEQPETASEPA